MSQDDQTRRPVALGWLKAPRRPLRMAALSLTLLALMVVGGWVLLAGGVGAQTTSGYYTLRVYGRSYFGLSCTD